MKLKGLYTFDEDDHKYLPVTSVSEIWEEYEEPKEYWYIDIAADKIYKTRDEEWENDRNRKIFGNYFETKEEAEKAAEKLRAWKRLKDKGFEIHDWCITDNNEIRLFGHYIRAGIKDDLDLLFGGKE